MAADEKVFRQRIHRLCADAVEADAELENVVVIFRAGVDLGNAVHDFAERNAAAKIPHRHAIAVEADVDFLAVAHDEFINGIVHDFLEQHVAAVVRMRARADAPDIHAGAEADVLERGKSFNFAFVVNCFWFFSHRNSWRRN